MPLPMEPITLQLVHHNEIGANLLLTYQVEVVNEDNIPMLCLGNGVNKVRAIRSIWCVCVVYISECVCSPGCQTNATLSSRF